MGFCTRTFAHELLHTRIFTRALHTSFSYGLSHTGFVHELCTRALHTGFELHMSFCARAFSHEPLHTSFARELCIRAFSHRLCTRALHTGFAHEFCIELCTRDLAQELFTRAFAHGFMHTSLCTRALHTSFVYKLRTHGLLHTSFLYTSFFTHELCTNQFVPCTNRFLDPLRICCRSHPRMGLVIRKPTLETNRMDGFENLVLLDFAFTKKNKKKQKERNTGTQFWKR